MEINVNFFDIKTLGDIQNVASSSDEVNNQIEINMKEYGSHGEVLCYMKDQLEKINDVFRVCHSVSKDTCISVHVVNVFNEYQLLVNQLVLTLDAFNTIALSVIEYHSLSLQTIQELPEKAIDMASKSNEKANDTALYTLHFEKSLSNFILKLKSLEIEISKSNVLNEVIDVLNDSVSIIILKLEIFVSIFGSARVYWAQVCTNMASDVNSLKQEPTNISVIYEGIKKSGVNWLSYAKVNYTGSLLMGQVKNKIENIFETLVPLKDAQAIIQHYKGDSLEDIKKINELNKEA
ncbi:hypothetical protein ACTFIU_006036 [Dictyostelium citrinum]